MGMKKVYTCDICREEKSPGQLIGCIFSNFKTFELGSAHRTDGVHICKDCLKQIKDQAGDVGI